MASKPSLTSSAQGAALATSATPKPSAANGTSTGSSQFDEAFASALGERFGVNGSGKQSAQGLSNARRETPPTNQKEVADAPNVANLQAMMPVAVTTELVPEGIPVIAVKTLPALLTLARKDSSSSPITPEGEAKNNQTKKGQQASSQGDADAAALNYPTAIPLFPALPSAAANSKSSPAPSSESPAPIAQEARIVPQITAPSAGETEAFSINLTPKVISPEGPGTGSSVAPSPRGEGYKPEVATGQAVLPAKLTASPLPPAGEGQVDLSKQIVQPKKAGSLSATSSPAAAPSSLGQSSGVDREGKAREKEEPILPASGVNDAGGSKQEFAGFNAGPASDPKETKGAGSTSEVRPMTQPTNVQDSAPAAGPAKEVAIRLQGQSGETINVKLVDQGGQVQVTVRSSDPAATSALRQDLSSLTSSLEKAGWKPEIALAANGSSFEPVNQPRQTDRNNQDSPGNRQPDWQQETPKKRQSASDMWDELLTNQTA